MAIFAQDKNGSSTPGLPKREDGSAPIRGGEMHTLLGKGSEFEGKLSFEGQVRIDGKFTGNIHTKDTLVIGEGAKVHAEILAGIVVVHGNVEGNIRATTLVELHVPARVRGTIETPALVIDKGVTFEGTCSMENITAKAAAIPSPAKA